MHFFDLPTLLRPGDCLVLNDSRVLPARLLGHREPTGGAVEVLLLIDRGDKVWECLVRPGRKLKPGTRLSFGDGSLKAEVVEVCEGGNRLVRFEYEGIFLETLERLGKMPLPPYIKAELSDPERYQTVYSREVGSAAAPTAGLHFTRALLEQVQEMGVKVCYVTLHVGLGTFRPVKEEEITDHEMHSEYCMISGESAETINIFIYPGYRFKALDCLITNFHLPESTLIMLVSALAGREHVLAAYKEAVEQRYRFFSFGDAMFIG